MVWCGGAIVVATLTGCLPGNNNHNSQVPPELYSNNSQGHVIPTLSRYHTSFLLVEQHFLKQPSRVCDDRQDPTVSYLVHLKSPACQWCLVIVIKISANNLAACRSSRLVNINARGTEPHTGGGWTEVNFSLRLPASHGSIR